MIIFFFEKSVVSSLRCRSFGSFLCKYFWNSGRSVDPLPQKPVQTVCNSSAFLHFFAILSRVLSARRFGSCWPWHSLRSIKPIEIVFRGRAKTNLRFVENFAAICNVSLRSQCSHCDRAYLFWRFIWILLPSGSLNSAFPSNFQINALSDKSALIFKTVTLKTQILNCTRFSFMFCCLIWHFLLLHCWLSYFKLLFLFRKIIPQSSSIGSIFLWIWRLPFAILRLQLFKHLLANLSSITSHSTRLSILCFLLFRPSLAIQIKWIPNLGSFSEHWGLSTCFPSRLILLSLPFVCITFIVGVRWGHHSPRKLALLNHFSASRWNVFPLGNRSRDNPIHSHCLKSIASSGHQLIPGWFVLREANIWIITRSLQLLLEQN